MTMSERQTEDCLQPGTPLLQGQFLIESFLNAGGFGMTYLARDSLDRPVVLKECYPNTMVCRAQDEVRARTRALQPEFDTVVRLFGQEARRLAKLCHPNIVGVHQVFEDMGTAYMALDFIEGRDLLDIIELEPHRLGPEDIRAILLKILNAVGHVHSQGILHRDISPDNILLRDDGEPILIDFGAARDQARRSSRILSSLHVVKDGYSPQEFYLTGTAQSSASDLYSVGATFYHLIAGAPPPNSHMRLAALAGKDPDPYRPLVGMEGLAGSLTTEFLAAVDQALCVFPKERLQSAAEWLERIDLARQRKVRVARAARDRDIELSIDRLVKETNLEVLRASAEAAEKEARNRARSEAVARENATVAVPCAAEALSVVRARAPALVLPYRPASGTPPPEQDFGLDDTEEQVDRTQIRPIPARAPGPEDATQIVPPPDKYERLSLWGKLSAALRLGRETRRSEMRAMK